MIWEVWLQSLTGSSINKPMTINIRQKAMANDNPKISILMPSYNHELYLEESIRSVWEQEYPNMELVIVDDGSTDQSRDLILKLKKVSPIEMKVIFQSNGGVSKALQRALESATGDIVGILASDDIMAPGRLMNEAHFFQSEKLLEVLYSSGQFLKNEKTFGNVHDEIERYLKKGVDSTLNFLLTTAPAFYIQAMLIRRDYLLSLGGFDLSTGSDDWALNIKIFKSLKSNSNFKYIKRNAFLYRLHGQQSHRNGDFMRPMKRNVVRKYFDLKNRSKYACQNIVKQALRFYLTKNIAMGNWYVKRAIKIGFAHGIPWQCLVQYALNFPGYLYREMGRKLNNKSN